MSTAPSPTRPTARRSRKSIAHPPFSEKSLDKENQTVQDVGSAGQSRKSGKRGLRSQSLGGGELQALKEATGNPQKIQPLPRSILKPSIALSPAKASGGQIKSQERGSPAANGRSSASRQSGLEHLPNPFQDQSNEGDGAETGTRVSLRTEEEQQSAAREKERQDAQHRREERRKSLANRRVSFAPEATLHTWNVVELPEDATSSSEATNSTRRASNGSTLPASPFPGPDGDAMSDASDPPSTPPGGEIQVAASPADQRNPHLRKRRRSSGVPQTDQNELSSSPMSSVASDDTAQSIMTDEVIDASESDEDKDLETEETVTATAIDNDDTTEITGASRSTASESSGRLDGVLREAAQRASMQDTADDEPTEDVSMDLANDETSAAFRAVNSAGDQNENLIDLNSVGVEGDNESSEMTMDVTQAIGGILSASQANGMSHAKRKSISRSRRLTAASRRRSSIRDSDTENETMEFTSAIGGIQSAPSNAFTARDSPVEDSDGEMTMELTTAVGGLARPAQHPIDAYVEQSLLDDDDGMEMTIARGGILSPVTERTEPSDESAIAMDFTAAVGAILPRDLKADNKERAKLLMKEETDHGQLTRSPFVRKSISRQSSQTEIPQTTSKASETGSPRRPSVQPKKSPRKSASPTRTIPPRSPGHQITPLSKAATPSRQRTPQIERPTTPSKTPPAKNVSMRRTSPKALFKHDNRDRKSTSPVRRIPDSKPTGTRSNLIGSEGLPPNLVLTPRSRRRSASGVDQQGLGSPKVAAILDRRGSIGNEAASFTPQGPGVSSVRFADPREMALEIDQERAEEQRRESGRRIMELEANPQNGGDGDTTSNLREIIDGLTPKKNKVNGRKSLAVGAARGLLGKRPLELDEDDEDATPKKLKGKHHSPVKKIHLPAPPSKDETTGRMYKGTRSFSKSMIESVSTPLLQPSPRKTASTPKDQGRFADTKVFKGAEKPPVSLNDQLAGEEANPDSSVEDEKIHLRDFLNMTSIRFMELTTTKRRHTVLPNKTVSTDGDDTMTGIGAIGQANDDRGLAACVVAGASTIPMLELYQHSCRELKKYISEGRNIVKEIEEDTYEDNPALFQEYMSATPQVRAIMDNQFKNVKTHARLLSKAMWYEWRMKLLDGLKEGLVKIGDGLTKDEQIIAQQEQTLEPIMPGLLKEHESLRSTANELETQADELADCNPVELQEAREQLLNVDNEIAAVRRQVEELKGELDEKERGINAVSSRKAACVQDIKEAEHVREQYRGWSAAEVAALKARVDNLERSTGWKLSSAQESSVTFTYKSSLSVFLTPSSFKIPGSATNAPNSPISLSYVHHNGTPSTTERFFLQLLRARVLCIQQSETPLSQLLKLLENGWELARRVSSQVADLKASWPTEEAIRGDDILRVTSTVLLRQAETKVDAAFEIVVGGASTDISATLSTAAKTVYGQDLKMDKMARVLKRESGDEIGQWAAALGVLEEKVTNYLREKQG